MPGEAFNTQLDEERNLKAKAAFHVFTDAVQKDDSICKIPAQQQVYEYILSDPEGMLMLKKK
ncbi:hypothetical protein [Marinococcus luteus]|uniref:hypothetical protein n=1 Tax=Marinococcus luteus TaxID=1122204 RepID=UPI002ACD37B9|nr:hypothetical protein [Marinococcus luteus]